MIKHPGNDGALEGDRTFMRLREGAGAALYSIDGKSADVVHPFNPENSVVNA
jgi:hypothetical protein